MRKLLILALIAVAALVVMGAHYSGGVSGSGWTEHDDEALTGSIVLKVYQWADCSMSLVDKEIKDYVENGYEFTAEDIGDIDIDSNAPVVISANVTVKKYDPDQGTYVDLTDSEKQELESAINELVLWIDLDGDSNFDNTSEPYIKYDGTTWTSGNTEVNSGYGNDTYDILLNLDITEDFPAGAYQFNFTVSISPTVQLPE